MMDLSSGRATASRRGKVTVDNGTVGNPRNGRYGEQFARALSIVPGAVLHGVTSRGRSRAEEFAARVTAAHAYRDYDELLQDPAVDIVYIATRNEHHHDDSIAALHSGKPVLCEKPFALTAAQGRAIATAARERKLFLMEAMWMRLNPAIRKIVELVEEGAIGWVSAIHADFGLQGPFEPEHRLRNPRLGGGALLDLGVYPINLAHLIMGSPASVQSWAHLTPEGVDETTGVLLDWQPGAVAALTCSINGESRTAASITGTEGRIDIPPGFFVPREFTLTRSGKAPETFSFPFDGNGYQFEAAEVQRCILAGELESPLVPHATTLEIMGLLDAIREEIGVTY